MTTVDVLIPVLNRPGRVAPLVESLTASQEDTTLRAVFVCSPRDRKEQEAVEATDARLLITPWVPGHGDYAKKINYAFRHTTEEWVFLAADDLCFCPGWADKALAHHGHVIGTNDLGNSRVTAGDHATHNLVSRRYIVELGVVDRPGDVLHEGYWHNFCDDELVGTARARGVWKFARDSWVEHLHPHWGKADPDDTYKRGQMNFEADRQLFRARQRLWGAKR